MKLAVYNQSGQMTGEEVEVADQIFGHKKIKPEVVHLVATVLLSNRRRSTASTKTRGEVRGGGKKPWQQKGTGRARAGSIRSPIWKGGGVVFGPRPKRNYYKKVNRKVKRLGIFSLLSERAKENKIMIVEDFILKEGRTKELLEKFKILHPKEKLLLILAEKDEKLIRACANLPNLRLNFANNLNFLNLLWAEKFIILKDGLGVMEKTYLASAKPKMPSEKLF